jgi:hypothetical protein
VGRVVRTRPTGWILELDITATSTRSCASNSWR